MNDAKGGSNQFVALKMTLKTTHLNLPFFPTFCKVLQPRQTFSVLVLSQIFFDYNYYPLVTMLRPASLHGAGDRLAFFAILATFCQFGDFGKFLVIFLAHFDSWAICDNSLQ